MRIKIRVEDDYSIGALRLMSEGTRIQPSSELTKRLMPTPYHTQVTTDLARKEIDLRQHG